MPVDRQFAAEAARALVVMVLFPLVVVVAISQAIGPSVEWEDVARALAWVLFLYVVVMARRYRQRQEHR